MPPSGSWAVTYTSRFFFFFCSVLFCLARTGIGPCGVVAAIVGGSDIWARGAMASSVVRYFGIV